MPLDTSLQLLYDVLRMLNPFQKRKLKIKTPSFERTEGKPGIVVTFTHLCPESKLKRSHRAVMSLCPIHGENNPSFAMYEETNTYYCFSCQTTGDSYKLIMEVRDLDFKGALQYAKENNLYDK